MFYAQLLMIMDKTTLMSLTLFIYLKVINDFSGRCDFSFIMYYVIKKESKNNFRMYR